MFREHPDDGPDLTSKGIVSLMDVTDAKDAYVGRSIALEQATRPWQPKTVSVPIVAGAMQGLDACALLLTSWTIGSLSSLRLIETLRPEAYTLTALLAGLVALF